MQLNPLGFRKEAFEVDRAEKSDADGSQDLWACIKEKVCTPKGEGQQDAECKVLCKVLGLFSLPRVFFCCFQTYVVWTPTPLLAPFFCMGDCHPHCQAGVSSLHHPPSPPGGPSAFLSFVCCSGQGMWPSCSHSWGCKKRLGNQKWHFASLLCHVLARYWSPPCLSGPWCTMTYSQVFLLDEWHTNECLWLTEQQRELKEFIINYLSAHTHKILKACLLNFKIA